MKRKIVNQMCWAGVLAVLSAGNILFVDSGVWNVTAGTPLDLAGYDTGTYQVEGVSRLKDEGYIVTSKAAGFQSDIVIAVTFDGDGQTIRQVEVITQGETDGIGSQVMESAFLEQFSGVSAPVGANGKEGKEPTAESAVAAASSDRRIHPVRWMPEDQSPEAQAVRKLYQASLLSSAIEKQPLSAALADAAPEAQAAYQLESAGLTTSQGQVYSPSRGFSPEQIAAEKLRKANLTLHADGAVSPSRDGSPEGLAAEKLYRAGLLTVEENDDVPESGGQENDGQETGTQAGPVSGGGSEIDAIAGATISSTAVIEAVDQAHYFIREQVLE